MTMPSRRSFITGLVSLVAAPAIVRAGSLMPVRGMIEPIMPLYGISPGMEALQFMKELEELHARISRAFFMDLGAFGAAAVEVRSGELFHVPIGEIYR